jgi:hypothetical protein
MTSTQLFNNLLSYEKDYIDKSVLYSQFNEYKNTELFQVLIELKRTTFSKKQIKYVMNSPYLLRKIKDRYLKDDISSIINDINNLKLDDIKNNNCYNDYILLKLEKYKNDKYRKIISELKIIAPSIEDIDIINLYNKSISIHQKNMQNYGNFLENDILTNILDNNRIPYKKQVTINNDGIIIGYNQKKQKCFHIIDFIIGNNIEIGKSIIEYIVISCKTTCRERWTQDNWSKKIIPKLYILLTISDDYPLSNRFQENEKRKIISSIPKKNDDRLYKLNFDNLLFELSKHI